MLAELRMALSVDKEGFGYYQSSNMQGVLMEHLENSYAEKLHQQGLKPYSQHIEGREEKECPGINIHGCQRKFGIRSAASPYPSKFIHDLLLFLQVTILPFYSSIFKQIRPFPPKNSAHPPIIVNGAVYLTLNNNKLHLKFPHLPLCPKLTPLP